MFCFDFCCTSTSRAVEPTLSVTRLSCTAVLFWWWNILRFVCASSYLRTSYWFCATELTSRVLGSVERHNEIIKKLSNIEFGEVWHACIIELQSSVTLVKHIDTSSYRDNRPPRHWWWWYAQTTRWEDTSLDLATKITPTSNRYRDSLPQHYSLISILSAVTPITNRCSGSV